jgi:hypothetical protein
MSLIVPPRRGRRGRGLLLITGALLLLTAATTVATDDGRPRTSGPDLPAPAVTPKDAGPAELRAQLTELTSRYDALLADQAELQATVEDLTAERDRLERSVERFDEQSAAMEAARQLLLELRKETPDARPEAEAQLERIRSLALTADASHLGQLVDRLGRAAPAWLEWRFGEHASADDAAQAYVDSGASAFDSTLAEFRNEVLLSVADQLDGILTTIDRAR